MEVKFVNHVKITNFKNGKGPTWFLIPGGAGISPKYLEKLVTRCHLKGTVWSVELLYSAQKPDLITSWQNSILELSKLYPHSIFLGHSFGSMFLQSVPNLDASNSSFILIASSPHNNWQKYASKYWEKIDSKKSDHRETIYKNRKNSENFRLLCSSWADFYFLKGKMQYGETMLNKESYDFQLYEYANEHFIKNYRNQWSKWDKVTFVTGEFDYVTPFEIFADFSFEEKTKPSLIKIKNAGHFPWIENLKDVKKVLKITETL